MNETRIVSLHLYILKHARFRSSQDTASLLIIYIHLPKQRRQNEGIHPSQHNAPKPACLNRLQCVQCVKYIRAQ